MCVRRASHGTRWMDGCACVQRTRVRSSLRCGRRVILGGRATAPTGWPSITWPTRAPWTSTWPTPPVKVRPFLNHLHTYPLSLHSLCPSSLSASGYYYLVIRQGAHPRDEAKSRSFQLDTRGRWSNADRDPSSSCQIEPRLKQKRAQGADGEDGEYEEDDSASKWTDWFQFEWLKEWWGKLSRWQPSPTEVVYIVTGAVVAVALVTFLVMCCCSCCRSKRFTAYAENCHPNQVGIPGTESGLRTFLTCLSVCAEEVSSAAAVIDGPFHSAVVCGHDRSIIAAQPPARPLPLPHARSRTRALAPGQTHAPSPPQRPPT